MEDDPLLELARLEALSAGLPSAKPSSGVPRRPEEARRVNGGEGSAHAVRGTTSLPTPGMIPVSQNDLNLNIAAARADYNAAEHRHVRPLPPPVVRRNENTLFRPGAANATKKSKYGSGDAMALPSSTRGYKDLGQGSLIRKYSGLNVKNPLVLSSQLEARLEAQSVIKLSDITSRNHSTGLASAWATLAAVGEISPRQEDSQGRPFAIWKLTDLNDTMITLFLFGNAYRDCHDDIRVGAVVALFGAKIRSEGGKFSLSINSGDSILELGTASEFGFCKSKTKNGQPCRVPVNTKTCEFCAHHVQKEYNNLQSKRHELQGNSLKSAFQPALKSKLAWNPGSFQPLNAVVRPNLPAVTVEQLKAAAGAAAARGGLSSGARYIKTVADPMGARSAAQEIELSRLRNNTLAPGAAPIPLARASKVVMQAPPLARKQKRGGGANGAGDSAPAAAAGQSKRSRTGTVTASKDDDEMVELDDDDIFEGEMQPAPKQQQQRSSAAGVDGGRNVGADVRGGVGGSRSNGAHGPIAGRKPAAAPATARQPAAAPIAARKAPPPSGAVDEAKQRAIEIVRSKKLNASTSAGPNLEKVPSYTPAFLMAPLEHREKEKKEQQEQDQDQEVELDADEDDGGNFTIPAKHGIGGDSNRNTSGRTSNFSTVAGTKFFGSTATRPPPPSSSGIIPGLGPASKQKSSSTKTGKSLLSSNGISNNVPGKGPRSGATGGGGGGPKKTGFAAAFGSVIAEMERAEAANPQNNQFKGSLYQDIVEQQDNEQLFNLMGVLERKDNMASQMDAIKSQNVTAWKCDVCSSITEYPPKPCREAHPHALTKMQAIKRFWQCGGCKGRFNTVGVRYPTSRCPRCDVLGTDFIQVSMLKPQKKLDHEMQQGNVAGRELLVARGAEQKWVNR